MTGIRLADYLVSEGISVNTEKARNEIIAGWVKIDGETVRIPSKRIKGDEIVSKKRPGPEYASRGGEKLKHALDYFNISVEDKIIADLGSSTGGFTDCLLQYGAKKVYAIDVGYGIIDYKLREDDRVVVKERKNVKDLTTSEFDDRIEFITADLSFISIVRVFDKIKELFFPAEGIVLIKPQFESRQNEHNKGVVENRANHKKILDRVINSLLDKDIFFKGLHFSPLKGPAGNIEFLLYFSIGVINTNKSRKDIEKIIDTVLDEAYRYQFQKK